MPIHKSRLSKVEQARYRACLEELRAGGLDVDIPPEWAEDSGALDIFIHCDPSTAVVEGPRGGVFYVVHTRLVARRSYVIVLGCDLETEWNDDIVLQSFQTQESIYRLGPLQYPAKEVLNDRIENRLQFSHRGQMVEGVILFSGLRPLPEHFCRGMSVAFRLTFFDQFENPIPVESDLFVDRTEDRRAAVAHSSSRSHETAERQSVRRSTLFDGEAPPDRAVEALTAYSPDKTACSLKEGAQRFGRPEHSCREGACNPLDRGCG